MQEDGKMTKRERIQILFFMAIVIFLIFIRDRGALVNSYNTTLFALTYKYGFISRGLSGTLYWVLDQILPMDIMSYPYVYYFVHCLTFFFYLCLLFFWGFLLKRVDKSNGKSAAWLIFMYTVYAAAFFASTFNFGRVDIYMTLIMMICVTLIVSEKWEWLLIPLSALGVMFHQGYVFMFFNMTLVLLLYKYLSASQREKKKYMILFLGCFLTGSALFLYFEFFSHTNGVAYFNEVSTVAERLSEESEGAHEGLLRHELLGTDLTDSEVEYHYRNFVELPIFLVVMSPYLLFLVRFFAALIKNAQEKTEQCKYLLLAIGAGTILPNLILKVDYGRWMFSVITYYCMIILALLAMKDDKVMRQLQRQAEFIKDHPLCMFILLLPILMAPFWDVNICKITAHFGGDLNQMFFHLWTD